MSSTNYHVFSCRHCALALGFCLRLSHGMVPLNHFRVSSTNKKSQFSRASLYLNHPAALLTTRNIAVMLEHVYGAALFILMLIVRLCVFKMYLALTATCREHRAFLLESATREEQQRVNRGQGELEADRRSNAEEERPRRFERRRLPVQHDERRCLGVSIRFIKSFYD